MGQNCGTVPQSVKIDLETSVMKVELLLIFSQKRRQLLPFLVFYLLECSSKHQQPLNLLNEEKCCIYFSDNDQFQIYTKLMLNHK